jgi:hypothetical protein
MARLAYFVKSVLLIWTGDVKTGLQREGVTACADGSSNRCGNSTTRRYSMKQVHARYWAAMAILGLACAGARAATDPQQILADDQKEIQQAQENYTQTVLYHGATSDDALKAKNKWDGAKNKYEVDKMRVQQLQQMQSSGTVTAP